MPAGRPSKFKDEYVEQARKLAALGATDQEIADFFELMPHEDDWLLACLMLIRQDRNDVIAARKKEKSLARRSRLRSSPSARVRNAMSARMWAALKGRTDGALFSRLGYSLAELTSHLERQFSGDMTWGNYGEWHVDHIKPCAMFDLTDPSQFKECWSLTNLQPLWASDNVKKGAFYGAA